jgi:UDP-N-acetylmuramyl pentapeptide synthase
MKELIKYIIVKIITIEAKLILNKHKPFIIGITGNLGKTSTKDSVVAALSDLQVRGTEKSLNSEFGVPLTVIGEKSGWGNILKWFYVIYRGVCVYFGTTYPKYLVLEIGADHKGDIESVTKWVKTDITILTQFSEIPVHVENFANREELVREKQFLAEAVKEGGVFIYNSDCKDSRR